MGSIRMVTADSPWANPDRAWESVVLAMAWLRVAPAWEQIPAASLGSRRAASADRPWANRDRAEELVVLAMAWLRVAAAWAVARATPPPSC